VPGSPAETGGLERSDLILAVDGMAVNQNQFVREIGARKPGEEVQVTVTRFGTTQSVDIKLAADPYPTYSLKPMDDPTDLQRAIYKSWLGIQ
jgi:predicted metalloprotease with PDZ domain